MGDCVDLPEDEDANAHFRLAQTLPSNYRAAVQLYRSSGRGSRAAISSKKWPAITRSSLERKLQSGPGPTAISDCELLHLAEERQLITWALGPRHGWDNKLIKCPVRLVSIWAKKVWKSLCCACYSTKISGPDPHSTSQNCT